MTPARSALLPVSLLPSVLQEVLLDLAVYWHGELSSAAIRSLRKLPVAAVDPTLAALLTTPHAEPHEHGALDVPRLTTTLEMVASRPSPPSRALVATLVSHMTSFGDLHDAAHGRPFLFSQHLDEGSGVVDDENFQAGNATVALGCHAACAPRCAADASLDVSLLPHCRQLCHTACMAVDLYEAAVLETLHVHRTSLHPQGEGGAGAATVGGLAARRGFQPPPPPAISGNCGQVRVTVVAISFVEGVCSMCTRVCRGPSGRPISGSVAASLDFVGPLARPQPWL